MSLSRVSSALPTHCEVERPHGQAMHDADFEHGALYFNLEPPALDYARDADVLVLGNSRLQVALSNDATADWFKQAAARYYLLAFSYNEDMVFTEDLLRKIHPKASVYIVNVGDFFERRETAAAKSILHDSDARSRYEWKRFAQWLHRPICGTFPKLCGQRFVIFRSRKNRVRASPLAPNGE